MIINNFKNVYDSYNRNRRINHQKPVTLRELERITGVHRSSLRRIYKNKNKGIQYNTLDKLIKFFGVPMDKIIEYRSNPYKFQLIDDMDINKHLKLNPHQKLMATKSVVLFNLDYKIPVVLTPFPAMKSGNSKVIRFSLGYSTLNPNKERNHQVQNIIDNFSNDLIRYLIISIALHGGIISKKTASKYMSYEWWGTMQAPTSYHIFKITRAGMIGSGYIKLIDIPKLRRKKYDYTHGGIFAKFSGNQQKVQLFDKTTVNLKD